FYSLHQVFHAAAASISASLGRSAKQFPGESGDDRMTMPVLNKSRASRAAATAAAAAILALALSVATSLPAFGGGYEVPMQNARASGQADAFIAQADDASAIWYNPAGLTQIHGTQFVGGLL